MPLSGIKVIDLSRMLSGPFCGMLLADMGAEVIKIEPPDGDPIRNSGALRDGLSWYFATFNRNKKSITLNLKHDKARQALERLVTVSDVVMDNFRPGVLDRLGLGRERLHSLNPRLIIASISGFGESGPYRDRPAYDFIAQAMSGFMSMCGEADGPPLRSGLPVSDLVAGLYAALGIVSALLRRERTGKGDVVTTNLVDAMISLLSYAASTYFTTGKVLARTGNDHPITAPYGLFNTADGAIAIAPASNEMFGRFMRALDMEALIDEPDFATGQQRAAHRADINARVTKRLAEHGNEYWIEHLNRAGVPCGPVYSVEDVFKDAQFSHMALDVPHPGYGPVRVLGFPLHFAGGDCRMRRPSPGLGEHNAEVFGALGLSAEEIESLSADGAA
jgi:crotonobetainyl-CoA:carnitine CoA-transferase CaiB-like acyl-CoA transferase